MKLTPQNITGQDVWDIYLTKLNLNKQQATPTINDLTNELIKIGFSSDYVEIIVDSLFELAIQGRFESTYIIGRVQDVITDIQQWVSQGEKAI